MNIKRESEPSLPSVAGYQLNGEASNPIAKLRGKIEGVSP